MSPSEPTLLAVAAGCAGAGDSGTDAVCVAGEEAIIISLELLGEACLSEGDDAEEVVEMLETGLDVQEDSEELKEMETEEGD